MYEHSKLQNPRINNIHGDTVEYAAQKSDS